LGGGNGRRRRRQHHHAALGSRRRAEVKQDWTIREWILTIILAFLMGMLAGLELGIYFAQSG